MAFEAAGAWGMPLPLPGVERKGAQETAEPIGDTGVAGQIGPAGILAGCLEGLVVVRDRRRELRPLREGVSPLRAKTRRAARPCHAC